MELTQTVSVLQDEVTLLKGEIKTVLKELRAALLSNDNPFSLDAPKFHSVGRPAEGGSAEAGSPGAPAATSPRGSPPPQAQPEPPPAQTPVPQPASQASAPSAPPSSAPGGGGPSTIVIGAGPGGSQAAPTEGLAGPAGTAPIAGPETPAPSAAAPGEVAGPPAADRLAVSPLATESTGHEPVPLHPSKKTEERAAEADLSASMSPRWDLLTIASLAAWMEDALASLGTRRLRLVLDLACFAELISADVRDVLHGMAHVEPEQTDGDRPMNINECLVVLHQLEAILKGEKVSKQPRRRASRRRRVR